MNSHRKLDATLLSAVTVGLLAAAFYRMRSDLLVAWGSEEYGHGMIIPFIALLMGWHILTGQPQKPTPSWLGPLCLLASSALLLVAVLAAFQAAAHYGFIIALVGACLTFLGVQATWRLMPAFGYLFFAIPLPHLLYANLSQELQLLSSTVGVKMLEMLGISVYQEGNIIDLGSYKLQVAEACSGLRYLFPLISFGYLAAYLMRDSMWKRLVVLFSAIPITIFMNTLRIALIGVTVDMWGPEMAEGLLHQLEGWVVFTLCVGVLLGEAAWLMHGTGHFRFEIFTLPQGRMLRSTPQRSASGWAAFAISLVLALVFGSGIVETRKEIIPDHPAFSTFPIKMNDWIGDEKGLDRDILASLQLSDYWIADYAKPDSPKETVNLYIAYYATQRIGSSTHSPSHCIPGGGWQVEKKSLLPITLADGTQLTVTRMLIRRGGVGQLVYFWFSERGRTITETPYAKWYLLVDSIKMRRSDGSLIRLVTPLSEGETAETGDSRLQSFMNDLQPELTRFIPGRELNSSHESTTP